jgi:uncharacterized pyridoxal phosphate-containing UPF0001 family protein
LHGYGNLQTNKVRRACSLFDVIESAGSDSLLEQLRKCLQDEITVPPICIQINIGAEPQKSGYLPDHADAAIYKAMNFGLKVIGVMAIPPRNDPPAQHFRWLRQIAERHFLPECLMGMSNDYHIAIDQGATSIRIGRVIFGGK